MKNKVFIAAVICAAVSGTTAFAQNKTNQPSFSPLPENSGKAVASRLTRQTSDTARERRAQAYAKLLEAQRYIWLIDSRRVRTEAAMTSNLKLAKQALQQSVELDPNLAEAYTALANLAKITPPYDISSVNESILLAGIAIKIDRNNFGAHQILAQLYTYKSNLNRGALEPEATQKAIAEWREIARLDPRNAEAFAFLSEFYSKTNQNAERISALQNWLSASTPISNGFYGRVYQGESLVPQTATVKLGQALLEDKQMREAVEILSRAVAEEPENTEAIELLRLAIASADNQSVKLAIQSLQQAVFANPDNPSISLLLAQVQSRTGQVDDAVKILRDASVKFAETNKVASADLQVALADIYGESNRIDEAAAVYQNALTTRGIVVKNNVLIGEERNFAAQVYEKIINLYKKANRPNDAKAASERAKILLGQ